MALIDCPACGGSGCTEDEDGHPDEICGTCLGRRKIDESRR